MRTVTAAGSRIRDWVGELLTVRRRESMVQAGKMTLAAVVAWLIARQVHQPQSFIAPYVAVFLISQTVYRSFIDSARQLAAIIVGVGLAFAVIMVVQQQVLGLAIAVFVGMLIGQGRWLGDSGIWVGVVALLMVTSHTADNPWFLVYRVVESVIGAGVGAAVNLLVLPPVHLRKAERVITDVSEEISRLLATVAEGIRREWHDWDTASWLSQARDLDRAVDHAREAVGKGFESTRFNPRWRKAVRQSRNDPAAQWSAIDTLGEVARQAQRMTEALNSANRSDEVLWPTDEVFNDRYAGLLERLSAGVERYQSPDSDDQDTLAEVARGREDTERMARELAERVDGRSGWTAQGALLVAAERAFRALEADTSEDE